MYRSPWMLESDVATNVSTFLSLHSPLYCDVWNLAHFWKPNTCSKQCCLGKFCWNTGSCDHQATFYFPFPLRSGKPWQSTQLHTRQNKCRLSENTISWLSVTSLLIDTTCSFELNVSCWNWTTIWAGSTLIDLLAKRRWKNHQSATYLSKGCVSQPISNTTVSHGQFVVPVIILR
jgi:hypothetical protein